jgi:hypothetical protein
MTVTFSYYRYITNSAIDGWNNRESIENLDLYLDEIKG